MFPVPRAIRFVPAALALLTACATEAPPYAAPPAAAGKACAAHSDCAAAEVCAAKACGPMFPRTYTLTLQKATLSSIDETGINWDSDGPPDAFVRMTVDTKLVAQCQSAPVNDTTSPVWQKTCAIALTKDSVIDFEVLDHDVPTPKLMSTKSLTAQDLESQLRGLPGRWQDSVTTLDFALTPQ